MTSHFTAGYRKFAEQALECKKEGGLGEMLRYWERELARALQKDQKNAQSLQETRAKVSVVEKI